MPIQAVVFDLDGTLLNSLVDIANAANWVLERHSLPTHTIDSYRYSVGSGVRHLLNNILPEEHRGDKQFERELIAEFIDRYHETWNVASRLYDGISQMLDELTRREIALAVLSNKPQTATSKCVDYFLPGYAFSAVFGQSESRPPKPDLTGAHEILECLGVAPQACLYLGDTSVDMQTASGASMIPVGVTWGFRKRPELEEAGALHIIDHPRQVLDVIEQTDN